jgi:redox-sensing transcriptional repressor
MGKEWILSEELSTYLQLDAQTIRKDFSAIGAIGKKGIGYSVMELEAFFERLLGLDVITPVALIGVGNLGTALLNYNFLKNQPTHIVIAFDIDDQKVGKKIAGVPIYHFDEIEERLAKLPIEMVILTVPVDQAQRVTNRLESLSIKGILNFSPTRLVTPPTIRVEYIDLSIELQTLAYHLRNQE